MTTNPDNSRRKKIPAIALTLATLLLLLYVVWRLDTAPRTDDAYAYADTIQVVPEVSGKIVDLPVKDNQAVKQGDLLFQIDARPFQDRLRAARARLVKSITDRKLTNVVIASGDAHLHLAGVVPVRDEEPDGPAAATEFLATSISSGGDGAPDSPYAQRFLSGGNPNLALACNQRGYQTFDVTAREWRTDIKVLDRVQTPGGKLSVLARFAVTPDAPVLHKV